MRNAAKTLSLTFPAMPESVPQARRALTEFAASAGATRRQLDAVGLASSEAVTNAVVHAYRGEPGTVYITAALVSDELWILVGDDGCGMQPRTDRPGLGLGLGLGLISQLVDDMAVVPRPGAGTEVRMRLDLHDAGFRRRRAAPPGESRASEAHDRRAHRRQSLA